MGSGRELLHRNTVSKPGEQAGSFTEARTIRQGGATLAMGIVLLCLALAGRRMLDRRRLADWEAAWATIGPQWTKHFRSRG